MSTIWISLSVAVSRFDSMRRFSSVSTGMFCASSTIRTMVPPFLYSSISTSLNWFTIRKISSVRGVMPSSW